MCFVVIGVVCLFVCPGRGGGGDGKEGRSFITEKKKHKKQQHILIGAHLRKV